MPFERHKRVTEVPSQGEQLQFSIQSQHPKWCGSPLNETHIQVVAVQCGHQ